VTSTSAGTSGNAETRTVDTARGPIGVLDSGAGHPVLLLHPLAQSAQLWRPLLAAVEGLRFLAVDAPGHGATPWDGTPFTVADMAGDAVAVLEALGLDAAAVVGMSMGGATAVELAGTRPELVSSLALVDTTACYGENREREWAERAERAAAVPRPDQLSFQIERWFSPRTVEGSPETVERVCAIFAAADSAAHAAACRALGGFDGSGLLGAIAAPTLVVVGADDYATPPAMARELHAGIAGSRLEILADTRHLSVLDNPRAWELVTEHLAATTGAAVRS
jgi:3-oxoadipate enol-lactonase